MSAGPVAVEIVLTFCLAAGLLYQYGNWYRHHVIVTLSVLIAWYFSFIIIFILPLDVSGTIYRQCVQEHEPTSIPTIVSTAPFLSHPNITINGTDDDNVTSLLNFTSLSPTDVVSPCVPPWSFVDKDVLCELWRVVYWTSQCLTWLILPLMQSYTQAGDFTVGGKLKSALIDNAIYYGSYMFICGILLIYIAIRPELSLDKQQLKAIAAAASNTWGLFLLVLLLGYGLVEVPRTLWNSSKRGYTLQYAYFKVAKLSNEKGEAEESLDDVLEALQAASEAVRGSGHKNLRQYVETILQKVPPELRDRMNRRHPSDELSSEPPSERALVRLHKSTIKSLQRHHRTQTQWSLLTDALLDLEDISRNQASNDRSFKPTFPDARRPTWLWFWYTPTLEWYWKCLVRSYVLKMMAVFCTVLSVFVVWSEVTFFNPDPVLSLFAVFVNMAKRSYDYLSIEVIACVVIAYLCVCAYYTIFKIRVLNLYYLAPYHQTDEYSLIFSGMLLCRLTPPLCLNFLGLVHMDSHIIKESIMETCYTKIMGHMDVLAIVSDGFNVYFPMGILALCLATYFNLGSRLLTLLSFEQFIGDNDITSSLVEDGRELMKREKRRRQRLEESSQRQREFKEKFGTSSSYRNARQRAEDRVRTLKRADSTESARAELLGDAEPVDYMGTVRLDSSGSRGQYSADGFGDAPEPYQDNASSQPRMGPPPRGIFDDV